MTKNDFDRWWADLSLRFPTVEAWLLRNHDTELSQRTLLKTWLDVLGDVELAAALEVNRQMQAGDMDWPGGSKESYGFEERLPQHVRRLAKQLSWERSGVDIGGDLPSLGDRGTGFPGKQILLRMAELQQAGQSREQAREQALREFPVGESRWRDPRYNCHRCLDSRRVHVASPAAIRAMLSGTFADCRYRDAVMRCSCVAGTRLVRKSQGREVPLETFNDKLDFAVSDPLWQQPERDRFADWCYEQRDKSADVRAQACVNYDASFAAFNERSFAP